MSIMSIYEDGPGQPEKPAQQWLREAQLQLEAADELAGRQARNIEWQRDLIEALTDAVSLQQLELHDIDTMTADLFDCAVPEEVYTRFGNTVPLRDRVAALDAALEDVRGLL